MNFLLSVFFFFNSYGASSQVCSKYLKPVSKSVKKYIKKLDGLNYVRVEEGNPKTLKDDLELYPYPYLEIPEPIKNKKPDYVKIEDFHFMQRSVRYKSSSSKGGYSVIDNAKKLQSGELKVEDFPIIEVWMDETGRIWTVNHRRLVAMVLSGVIKEVPVKWIKPRQVFEVERSKFWPVEDGKVTWMIDYKSGIKVIVSTRKNK